MYSLFERREDLFVHYAFSKKTFEDYLVAAGSGAPAEALWRASDDGSVIEVSSLALLERVLPEMVAGGFYLPGQVYQVY